MVAASQDRSLNALRRLMRDASEGGSKVEALVAIVHRNLFVPTWTQGGTDFRTLINSDGDAALAVFTDLSQLEQAADRFAWRAPDGELRLREIAARDAFQHVIGHDLAYVVIDVTAEHSLEAERVEVEPLITVGGRDEAISSVPPSSSIPSLRRESEKKNALREIIEAGPPDAVSSSGRYGAARRMSRPPTEAPAAISSNPPANPDLTTPERGSDPSGTQSAESKGSIEPTAASFFCASDDIAIVDLPKDPSDDTLDVLTNALRTFPEIEWAAYCAVQHKEDDLHCVAVRLIDDYRDRLEEIANKVQTSGELKLLLLDNPASMRQARSEGMLFFPWRRRRPGR